MLSATSTSRPSCGGRHIVPYICVTPITNNSPTFSVDREKQWWRFFAANLLAGGMAGATSNCIVYPLDFARTRLAMDMGRMAGEREYRGLVHCLISTVKSDGPVGLYRGFIVSIQRMFIYRACYFGLFDTIKAQLQGPERARLGFATNWLIAQAVTSASGMVAYPWDTVCRRMMMQSGRSDVLYTNSLHCLRRLIIEEGGPRALYKGALSNIYRGTGGALVMTLYEESQKYLR